MTKRISQPAVEAVPVTAAVAATPVVAAVAPAADDAEAVLMVEADVAAAPVVQDMTTTTTTTQDTMASPDTGMSTTTTVQETTTTTTDDYSDETDYTPFIVGGVLLAGGILAVALSGGDDDDDNDVEEPEPEPENVAPTFTSGATATVAENAAATTVVYDAAATDADGDTIRYSLSGDDAGLFTIDATTGEVRLNQSADFEADATYNFTVTATDNGSPAATATRAVTVTVTNVNEAPTFATATATVDADEGVDAGTLVYTAVAGDGDADDSVTFSLTGEDADAFAIDAETGEVTFVGSPDFETQSSYTVNVVATDEGGLTATQVLTVNVNNANEAPTFDVEVVTVAVDENVAAGTVVFTAMADDIDGNDTVTYSLTGDDADAFEIDADTGEVTFVGSPDFEMQASYTVTVVATDAAGLTDTQTLVVNVNDLDEVVSVELDGGDIPTNTEVDFDGMDGDVAFIENAAEGNLSVISNFGEGDTINVDVAADNYSFTSIGNDVVISFNNNGTVSQITIEDVVELNEFVEDEESAEAAVGFDFFQSSVAPPPPPPAGEESLDVGGAQAVTIDAGDEAITFTESGDLPSNVIVTNFSDDDSIVVEGLADGEAYTFSSIDLDGNGTADLQISFNNGSTASLIVIAEAISADAFVEDEASAEAAFGADFFSYA